MIYGVCNVPLVLDYVLKTYARHTDNWEWYLDVYQFDTQFYYINAIYTVLIAVNSAANPILYFWRMPRLREFFKGILRLNKENRRPPNIMNQQDQRYQRTCSRKCRDSFIIKDHVLILIK